MITRTKVFPNVFDKEQATTIFEHLRDTIKWEESIRSKKGFTRLGKMINIQDNKMVQQAIYEALIKIDKADVGVYGCYLNYYKDGSYWTPSHTHPGSVQIILSFNERDGDRTLKVGKKDYHLENGSVIIFGASAHGIQKEEGKKGRISIAVFTEK